jgi:hypothetical protein
MWAVPLARVAARTRADNSAALLARLGAADDPDDPDDADDPDDEEARVVGDATAVSAAPLVDPALDAPPPHPARPSASAPARPAAASRAAATGAFEIVVRMVVLLPSAALRARSTRPLPGPTASRRGTD